MIKPNMTNEEVFALYPPHTVDFMELQVEDYKMPHDFEHRVEGRSLLCIYSMLRDYKPKTCLQIGCWEGGTTNVIMHALKKNGDKFRFVASEILADKRENTRLHTLRDTGIEPEMVGDCTKEIPKDLKNIDFLYHDTDHDKKTTEWVVENILPRLKDGALVIFHDWAVTEKDGEWLGKGAGGTGGWEETEYLLDLHRQGKLPFKKVYWNYGNPGTEETGVFLYDKT